MAVDIRNPLTLQQITREHGHQTELARALFLDIARFGRQCSGSETSFLDQLQRAARWAASRGELPFQVLRMRAEDIFDEARIHRQRSMTENESLRLIHKEHFEGVQAFLDGRPTRERLAEAREAAAAWQAEISRLESIVEEAS